MQLVGGNSALALAMTVSSNLLGIIIVSKALLYFFIYVQMASVTRQIHSIWNYRLSLVVYSDAAL